MEQNGSFDFWTLFVVIFIFLVLLRLGALVIARRFRFQSYDTDTPRYSDNPDVDPDSGEKVYDTMPLTEATAMKSDGEKYLLAECTPEQFAQFKRTGKPVRLGYYAKEKWTAGLPFYLFACQSCAVFGVDYKHGHRPYLTCPDCDRSNHFSQFKARTQSI